MTKSNEVIQSNTRIESVSGRATGVLFFAGFGSLWMYNGISAMHQTTAISLAAIAAIFAALALPALKLMQSASRAANERGVSDTGSSKTKVAFLRVNAVQWTAIFAAGFLFNLLHKPEFLTPAITFIVGAHLIPLARLFSYRAHFVTGGLLMLWATLMAVAFAPAMMPSIGALGTGAVLVASAAHTLVSAGRVAKAGLTTDRLHSVGA
jgi:hypothetical protein